jgi:hypothetical protein
MKSRVYQLIVRHYFFLTATLLASSIYGSVGSFRLGMTGFFLGAALVTLTTRGMGTK